MNIFGFTINLLTLFAIVLAIGIVVDDSIVIVEAVQQKLEGGMKDSKKATISAMSEITSAVISITVVMSAVFLPIGLIEGPVGVFYRQFAFTLAIAIVLSAVNALTLSPVLCALFLKPKGKPRKPKNYLERFHAAFNSGYNQINTKYTSWVSFLIKKKLVALSGLLVLILGIVILERVTPKAFIPTEDQSFVMTAFSLPPGASLERTKKLTSAASEKLASKDYMFFNAIVNGSNLIENTVSPSFAASYSILEQPENRGEMKDLNQIMDSIQHTFDDLPEGDAFTFSMPTVPGFGNVDALEVVLMDNTGGNINVFEKVSRTFITSLEKSEEIEAVFTAFNSNFPQYLLEVDEIKAIKFGLTVDQILETMQAYYGSIYTSDFNRFGKYYRVVVQAESQFRQDEASMKNVFAKNKFGKMVPINSVTSLERVFGPEVITHLNQAISIKLNVKAKKGYSTGDAIRLIDDKAELLPLGFSHEFIGLARQEQESGSQTGFVFFICIVFVYLLLISQFESYILPMAVLLSLPAGIFGVFSFINLVGVTNNIYVQISLIMLIGLLAKNAILIVEFSLQNRREGNSIVSSAIAGAKTRLRPILMTSFAFIAGLIPLLFAGGASAEGNKSIASSAIGGMLFGVLLGVLIIPVLFVIFQNIHEQFIKKSKNIIPQ